MRWVRRSAVVLSVLLVASAAMISGPAGATGSARSAPSAPSAAPAWCSRDVLRYAAGGYYVSLVAHDADFLPWASDAKLTQNAALTEPGQGFWQTAGPATFARAAFDTDTCSVHTQSLMNDGTRPAIVGVRFKLGEEGGRPVITESETYITHQGDYLIFSASGLLGEDAARPDTRWEQAVPEDQRSTRAELIELADRYFTAFGGTVDRTPFQTNCDRWENGFRTTSGDCMRGLPTGDGTSNFITHRRYPFVDVQNGVVVGYVLFGSYLDFHMFKIVDGQVRLISALVADSGHTTSGWEEQEGQP